MKITKLIFIALLLALGIPSIFQTASAHGERSLEPFVRMRTIQWYDVKWSSDKLAVNDDLVITGRFHVAQDWPSNLAKPDAAYLALVAPGPVFVRKERTINGESHVNSLPLKLGGDYEFRMVLKARIPGKYHIHPSFNIQETGNIAGPGMWITITGSASDFTNMVKLSHGEMVNLETYGKSNGLRWHMFWTILGVAWLAWWIRRPLFIPRYNLLKRGGAEDTLITPLDNKLAKGILFVIPAIVLGSYLYTISLYPETIPLQTSRDQIEPLDPLPNLVNVKVKRAEYIISSRDMNMVMEVQNNTDRPLKLGEFATGSVRFINPKIHVDYKNYSSELVAEQGLHVKQEEAIAPGASALLTVDAMDALWHNEHLSSVIKDADSRLGGLLFFYDDLGNRFVSSISVPIIPIYK